MRFLDRFRKRREDLVSRLSAHAADMDRKWDRPDAADDIRLAMQEMERLTRERDEARATAARMTGIVIAALEATGAHAAPETLRHTTGPELAEHIAGLREAALRVERAEADAARLRKALERRPQKPPATLVPAPPRPRHPLT